MWLAVVAGLFLLHIPASIHAEAGLQKGDLVAICGDSITEQKMYSRYIDDYLLMCQPQSDVEAMQFGWAGETAYLFVKRQKNDCLVFKPTVVTICYGMNDAGYVPTDRDRLNGYKKCLAETVKNFKDAGARFIIVGSPGVVDSDKFKKIDAAVYNQSLKDFADGAREVAAEQKVEFADLHSVMMETMAKAKAKYGKEYAFAGKDGVHPDPNGHLVMAYAFLKAMGCSGDIGTITVDLKASNATATDGHKIVSVSNGAVEVESSRYPFCFLGDAAQATTRSIIEVLPFNEELNRYKLVVKNTTSPKLKITWGKTSRIYPVADLEKGINLAADFIDNPFSETFFKIDKIILDQQIFETTATKTLLNSLLSWRRLFPNATESYDKMTREVVERSKTLRQESRAAVQPVKHTIQIEPAS